MQGDDDGDENGDEGDLGTGFPLGSFRPGRVVWAKVDGHEWWPAKVTFTLTDMHSRGNANTFSMFNISVYLVCANKGEVIAV